MKASLHPEELRRIVQRVNHHFLHRHPPPAPCGLVGNQNKNRRQTSVG